MVVSVVLCRIVLDGGTECMSLRDTLGSVDMVIAVLFFRRYLERM